MVLEVGLLFHKLNIAFVGKLKFLKIFVDLSELVRILLKALIESLVDIFQSSFLFFFFEFLDSFGHSLACLFRRLLHGDDFFTVSLIFGGEQLCKFLSKSKGGYFLV